METPTEHTTEGVADPFAYIQEGVDEGPSAFESVFPEANQEEAPQPMPEAGEVPQQAQQISPEEQRVRDWQAKYDSLQSEFDTYRTSSEDANAIWRAVQSNPQAAEQVLTAVEQSLSGNGSNAQLPGVGAGAVESFDMPQEPTPPERPSSYSDHDAFMEPGSDSWKHREALEMHRSEMNRYMMQKQHADLMATVAPLQHTIAQQKEAQAMYAQRASVQNSFMERGLSPEQTNEVMNWASNYQITPDDIVQLHRMKNQQAAPAQAPQQYAQPAQPSGAQKPVFPLPAATAGGSAPPQRSVEQSIMGEILAMEKENSAF